MLTGVEVVVDTAAAAAAAAAGGGGVVIVDVAGQRVVHRWIARAAD